MTLVISSIVEAAFMLALLVILGPAAAEWYAAGQYGYLAAMFAAFVVGGIVGGLLFGRKKARA